MFLKYEQIHNIKVCCTEHIFYVLEMGVHAHASRKQRRNEVDGCIEAP